MVLGPKGWGFGATTEDTSGCFRWFDDLAGDFNVSCEWDYTIVDVNGRRSKLKQGELLLRRLFNLFPYLTEVYQEMPTHRTGDTYTRLDRALLGIATPLLVDLRPQCATAWSFSHPFGTASDHLPTKAYLTHADKS